MTYTPLILQAAAPRRSSKLFGSHPSVLAVWRRLGRSFGRRRVGAALAEVTLAGAETLRARAVATEPDFLALGAELRELSGTAAAVAGRVGVAAARLQENLAAHRLAGDEGMVTCAIQDMEASVADVERCLAQLRRVSGGLVAMRPQIERIGRVGVLLQSTAVGFAVESARTAECQQAFGSFVDDIRGLSGRTREIDGRISAELATAHATEAGTLAGLEKELATLRELSREGAGSSERAAAEVQQRLEAMARVLAGVREQSDRIQTETAEAVFHLQFGDIVRQKVEHIAAALGEIAELGDGNAGATEEALQSADSLLSVQIAQLTAIEEEIEVAEQRLGHAFASIGAAATDVAHGGGPAEAAALEGLLRSLDEFNGLVVSAAALRQRVAESAGAAFAVAARIANEIQQVQAVNREMHLLALNAIVKAATLGTSGATLEVLSMQVHALYREADSAVAVIAELARQLEAESAAATVAPQGEGLAATVGQVRADAADFARTMGELRQEMGSGREQLSRATERLTTLAAYAAAVRDLHQGLAAARAPLAPWRDGGATNAPALADRYTMESERAVHRRIAEATGTASAAGAGNTIAKAAPAHPEKAETKPRDGERRDDAPAAVADLGDNVELF